jgi:hypothetical protein
MLHSVQELRHSCAFGSVASDQPKIFPSNTVRYYEGEVRNAGLCFSHNEPSVRRVATVEDDVDATGLNRRDKPREIHLSRLYLLGERGFDPQFLKPPHNLVGDALAIRLMRNVSLSPRSVSRGFVAFDEIKTIFASSYISEAGIAAPEH